LIFFYYNLLIAPIRILKTEHLSCGVSWFMGELYNTAGLGFGFGFGFGHRQNPGDPVNWPRLWKQHTGLSGGRGQMYHLHCRGPL
jgi:hypothetical protein